MVSSDKNFSNAVGAKSARACDNCIKKRARWYCAADDAFLCQSCDLSVHSANPLARRHERVRLKIASVVKPFDDESQNVTWHQGFTRKARTPRQKKNSNGNSSEQITRSNNNNPLHLVPEIYNEETSLEENEEQLLYRVPIFDPFVAELCTSANSNEGVNNDNNNSNHGIFGHETKHVSNNFNHEMSHFLPSEMDLAEFAADVESLLGNGLENESFDMEGLGLLDCDDEKDRKESSRVKIEDKENNGEVVISHEGEGEFIDLGRETFVLNFDYDSPILGDEEDNKGQNLDAHHDVNMVNDFHENCDDHKVLDSKKIFLRLDYEGVMSAWDDQKSPWTNGERPDLDSGECWPDCVGACGTMHVYGEMGMMSAHHAAMADGGREARVSRYREKRRTRLFSKKIRYEVRKLNAEKRPRMKGRFVKRANFVAPSAAFGLLNNK